jgi:hypothetical protein
MSSVHTFQVWHGKELERAQLFQPSKRRQVLHIALPASVYNWQLENIALGVADDVGIHANISRCPIWATQRVPQPFAT